MDKPTGGQTYTQADLQMDRPTDRQTYRQMDGWIGTGVRKLNHFPNYQGPQEVFLNCSLKAIDG